MQLYSKLKKDLFENHIFYNLKNSQQIMIPQLCMKYEIALKIRRIKFVIDLISAQ